jgi:hypothetical protein
MPFTVGVYFENSEEDRASFKTNTCLGWLGRCFEGMEEGYENLKIIDIPESARSSRNLSGLDIETYRENFRIPATNAYYRFLKHQDMEIIAYDPIAGVQPAHIYRMDEHLDKFPTVPASEKYVVFDWDRTLTVVEGLAPLQFLQGIPAVSLGLANYDSFWEDALVFLFGGAVRLQLLRDLMQRLIRSGITVFIITRNGKCGSDLFQTLVQTLHPYFFSETVSDYIVCGFRRDPVINYTKREALEMSPGWRRRSSPTTTGASKKMRGGHRSRRQSNHCKTRRRRTFKIKNIR